MLLTSVFLVRSPHPTCRLNDKEAMEHLKASPVVRMSEMH